MRDPGGGRPGADRGVGVPALSVVAVVPVAVLAGVVVEAFAVGARFALSVLTR